MYSNKYLLFLSKLVHGSFVVGQPIKRLFCWWSAETKFSKGASHFWQSGRLFYVGDSKLSQFVFVPCKFFTSRLIHASPLGSIQVPKSIQRESLNAWRLFKSQLLSELLKPAHHQHERLQIKSMIMMRRE